MIMIEKIKYAAAWWLVLSVLGEVAGVLLHPRQAEAWATWAGRMLHWYVFVPHPYVAPWTVLVALARGLPFAAWFVPAWSATIVGFAWGAIEYVHLHPDQHRRGAEIVSAAALTRLTRRK